ncbi:nucleotide-binding domain-containing protein [Tilletiaria anomala UBC 951]|uniref:Nucleotide-binding domain-containing protein n=1 Tax=Tilletiaria anomala (strain ATCC 24038 / CBS 436.72 / UBC 951) TaxID=1037660 RepID=A0A066VZ42_TILAU|nr:nucleotide-binding domain-containing protein [Tilletiaria anomala UBC 951]KDN43790.1 nucleotide-binding domain-containing protein [Tilletiaria anomala UBC 951]
MRIAGAPSLLISHGRPLSTIILRGSNVSNRGKLNSISSKCLAASAQSSSWSHTRRFKSTGSPFSTPPSNIDRLDSGSAVPSPLSTPSLGPEHVGATRRFLHRFPVIKWTLYSCGSIVFGLAVTIGLMLAYDFTTYREAHVGKVPLAPLALHPEPGGPKNLPILSNNVDDWQDEVSKELCKKERLVIVGGGWGAVSLLSALDPNKYNVTVVAPTNFYLFTPLLPSATVGTVEPRSLVESLRRIIARVHGHYVEGYAVDVVLPSSTSRKSFFSPSSPSTEDNLLEVQVIDGHNWENLTGEQDKTSRKRVYIPYDKLVIACGSVSNTHGVSGLENCFQLKTIKDARAIRSHIMDNLEMAALPTTTEEQRDRLLSFVICGGGPTGIETAAEIYDMMNEDVLKHFPKILRQAMSVHVIQSREHILNTYSEKISEYAEKKFSRDGVDLITNARVKRVEPEKVIYTVKQPNSNEVKEMEIPSGFTLWSTGIAMNPFTKRLTQLLPNQFHLKALQVDSHLRVKGAEPGTMYALGDASTIDNRLIEHLYEWVDKHDTDHDGQLTYNEFTGVVKDIAHNFPLASKHFEKMDKIFKRYDEDNDGKLGLNELASMFTQVQSGLTSLPATAQVASQQGKYLAHKLNKLAKVRDAAHREGKQTVDVASRTDDKASAAVGRVDVDDTHYKPFQYHNLGSLAYIGNAAAFDIPFLPDSIGQFAGGLIAMYAWRSFYLSEQVSSRTRLLLLIDYIKRGVYGRDMSRL